MSIRRLSGSLLAKVKAHLKKGGIIAYPVESCFGLGGLPNNSRAINKIIKLKKRNSNKGLIVIGGKIQHFNQMLFRLPENDINTIKQVWKNSSTTYLLPVKTHKTQAKLRGKGRDKLAVRIPQHSGAINLCNSLNTALISTSANLSRKRNCRSTREVKRNFGKHVIIISGRVGQKKHPSVIIDFYNNTIIRK